MPKSSKQIGSAGCSCKNLIAKALSPNIHPPERHARKASHALSPAVIVSRVSRGHRVIVSLTNPNGVGWMLLKRFCRRQREAAAKRVERSFATRFYCPTIDRNESCQCCSDGRSHHWVGSGTWVGARETQGYASMGLGWNHFASPLRAVLCSICCYRSRELG